MSVNWIQYIAVLKAAEEQAATKGKGGKSRCQKENGRPRKS